MSEDSRDLELSPSILVIEDDPAHAEAMVRGLESAGSRYRVRYASSLAQGRAELARELPLLVLADLHLRDGEALDLLSADQKLAYPLLILTSHGDERTAVQSIRLGAMDYVVKSPEAFQELPRIVERALREWRLGVEHQRSEQALRESEQRFRALFSAAPDPAFIFEPDGAILDCNRAAEDLFGRSRAQLLSNSIDGLGLEREDVSASAAWLAGGCADRVTGPDLMHFTRQDSVRVEIEARTVPLSHAGKMMVLATLHDVSPRLAAERARHRLEEQLHQAIKMDAIGRLAGGIAHDFNNLLTVISGYAELLLKDHPAQSNTGAGLSEILQAGARASALTTQLLAFSRKQVIEPRMLDLDGLLENAARMLERLIGEHLQLCFRPARNLYAVKVDPNQIEQLLINLAVNARDAMVSGGVLEIETANVSLSQTELEEHPDAQPGDYVRLRVTDNGAGMPPETLDRLFEPFFTTKERGRGTGLGLSIIYGIVKQNGGFIRVKSQLGSGTRFDIHLPRALEEPSEVVLTKPRGPLAKGRGTVLLVEDEVAVRDIAARFLRNAGYEVISAGRASEAIGLLTEKPELAIDVLVTDVVLPEMNGRQLFEHLVRVTPRLRAVFISGYPEEVIAQDSKIAANIAFLEKPFTQDALAFKVQEVLR